MSLIIPYNVAHSQSDIQIGVAIDWSIDGIKLAVGYQGGVVEIFDARSGETLWTHQFSDVVNSLNWHPTNPDRLAIGGGNPARAEGIVEILDVATNQIVLTLDGGEAISSISWSPDGTKLVAASNTIAQSVTARNELRIWDTTTGELLTAIAPVSLGNINAVSWSPDGREIAGGTSDYLVAIWDANTGNVLHTLQGHTAAILSMAWNYDGSMLASTSFGLDNTLRIWDTVSGQNLATFPTNFAGDVVWNPIRNELAVAEGQAVRLLDATTGDELAAFPANGLQQAVAYTPYGGRLAFGGEPSSNTEGSIQSSEDTIERTLSGGAVQIVVPSPSLERLQSIAEACNAPTDVEQALTISIQADQLTEFVAQVEALSASTIPPTCAADLIAMAAAIQSR